MEQVGGGSFPGRLTAWLGHAAIAICLALAPGILSADEPLEYQVKAAFLLNFTKFIDWPPDAFAHAESPVAICVLGDNPFGSALDQIVRGEVVNGRKVTVDYIRRGPAPQSCQVLYWKGPGKEIRTLPETGTGVLTVGEGEAFLRDGGVIAFVLESNRVRFEINETAAERAGLKLSSKLLGVAKSVEGTGR